MVAEDGRGKERKKKRKRVKKLARVEDATVAQEDDGLLNTRQKLKKRKGKQQNEEVEVVYLKHLFANRGCELESSQNNFF